MLACGISSTQEYSCVLNTSFPGPPLGNPPCQQNVFHDLYSVHCFSGVVTVACLWINNWPDNVFFCQPTTSSLTPFCGAFPVCEGFLFKEYSCVGILCTFVHFNLSKIILLLISEFSMYIAKEKSKKRVDNRSEWWGILTYPTRKWWQKTTAILLLIYYWWWWQKEYEMEYSKAPISVFTVSPWCRQDLIWKRRWIYCAALLK